MGFRDADQDWDAGQNWYTDNGWDADQDWHTDDDLDADDEWAVTELDARLRQEVTRLLPAGGDSYHVLGELHPALVSARRRRLGSQMAAATLAIGLMAFGASQLADRFAPNRAANVTAGPGLDQYTQTGPSSTASLGRSTSPLSSTDTGAGSSTTAPLSSAVSANAVGEPQSATADDSSTGASASLELGSASSSYDLTGTASSSTATSHPTTASIAAPVTSATVISSVESTVSHRISTTTTTAATTTSRPTTATSHSTTTRAATTTTTSASGQKVVVNSKCGSVEVRVTGSRVELTGVLPLGGNQPEVHNAGPELVDVSFDNRVQGCQVTAQVRNGQLRTTSDDD